MTNPAAVAAQIDKIRLLILGMETRLSEREVHLQEDGGGGQAVEGSCAVLSILLSLVRVLLVI
jgi:hypothetical protein